MNMNQVYTCELCGQLIYWSSCCGWKHLSGSPRHTAKPKTASPDEPRSCCTCTETPEMSPTPSAAEINRTLGYHLARLVGLPTAGIRRISITVEVKTVPVIEVAYNGIGERATHLGSVIDEDRQQVPLTHSGRYELRPTGEPQGEGEGASDAKRC
jgi:hypothetical protein